MKIVRIADLAAVAWKNNGGTTREIASHRTGNVIVWRMSLANVDQSGPFSVFSGLARILTVIDGAGMDLVGADELHRAEPHQPVQFSGEQEISGQLRNGPVRNVNLIYDPQRITAGAQRLCGARTDSFPASASRIRVFVCTNGNAVVGTKSLHWGDTCIAENGALQLALPEYSAGLLISLDTKCMDDITV